MANSNNGYKKYRVIGVIIFAIAIGAYIFRNDLYSIATLLSNGSIDDLVVLIRNWGIGAPIVSILLMILQAFIAPIPSFLITGANGVVFGVAGGILISWVGAMFGAAGTFYLARVLGEDFVRRFEKSNGLMRKVDEISKKHGVKVVFIGRLLPFVSFDFLSYAAGLSTMKSWHFFIATAIGMIPGTVAYVLLGNEIIKYSRYSTQILWITFIGVVLFIIYTKIRKVSRKNKDDDK